mmetsp:Transcript_54821/g.157644  ORF Transcript_54821/g.157644 Transcript_54821/m.157644 type:complete len:239 (-) Transcript_54821:475-1191(-)
MHNGKQVRLRQVRRQRLVARQLGRQIEISLRCLRQPLGAGGRHHVGDERCAERAFEFCDKGIVDTRMRLDHGGHFLALDAHAVHLDLKVHAAQELAGLVRLPSQHQVTRLVHRPWRGGSQRPWHDLREVEKDLGGLLGFAQVAQRQAISPDEELAGAAVRNRLQQVLLHLPALVALWVEHLVLDVRVRMPDGHHGAAAQHRGRGPEVGGVDAALRRPIAIQDFNVGQELPQLRASGGQ